ncbi:MAG: sigma-70 family RNA polymerase sigma factor [Spirochaetes bacterium]|nr:sigma-70 family RNA polymerase sigma factor [Spirochaetota bacterium]
MKLSGSLADPKVENFNRLYNSYYSLVFSIVFSKVNNYHDAEDICQEVFLRFYGKMQEIENPRKWILGCLRIVVIDFYKQKNRNDEDIDSLFNDISMGYINGFKEARVIISQIIEEVCDESGEEDGSDASIFNLIAVYRYSIVEAARHLKLNYKQTRYRYNRICEKIMSRLREKGIKELGDLL